MGLETVVAFSNRYGKDEQFVLAGGGNTSYKDTEHLYVKGSGHALATIEANGFVKMNRAKLETLFTTKYEGSDAEVEAVVLADMMNAKEPGEEAKRPSVEVLLHHLFAQTYVLHLHPALVNGLTCAQGFFEKGKELFGEKALLLGEQKPGYTLAMTAHKAFLDFQTKNGYNVNLLILQNHGIFFAADNEAALDALVKSTMDALSACIEEQPDFAPLSVAAELTKPYLDILQKDGRKARFTCNNTVLQYTKSAEAFEAVAESLTPDHLVYCVYKYLFVECICELEAKIAAFEAETGILPKVIMVKDLGLFSCADTELSAEIVEKLYLDELKIVTYTKAFGGVHPMDPGILEFVRNWEVESYRKKIIQ